MKRFLVKLLFLQILNIPFFSSNEMDIYLNFFDDNVGKDLFEEFLGVSKMQNENVIRDVDKKNLNIFNHNNEEVSLIDVLSKHCLSFSEKICLTLFLNNPSVNISEIKKRQNILSTLMNSEDFYEMEDVLYLFLESEQKFLDTVLYKQKYEYKSNKEIYEMLLSVQYFLKMIKKMYEIITNDEILYESLNIYMQNIAKIVKYENFSDSFKQTLNFFYKKKIRNKKIGFCRNKKIELLNNIYDHRSWFLAALFEFSKIFMFWNISKLNLRYVTIYDYKEKDKPYLKVEGMQNIYNQKPIDDTFTLRLKKTGDIVVMRLNNIFRDNMTTKVLLGNIYLAQVFGISFSNNFEFTIFDKMDTQISGIV